MENVMVDLERSVTLKVSEYFFRLTTEAIRLFSNSHRRYTALGDIVCNRASRLHDLTDCHSIDGLRDHLRLIPSKGDVTIEMNVTDVSYLQIKNVIPELECLVGSPVDLKDAVSLLLFDWIVECQATEIVMKLGLTAEQADIYDTAYRRPSPFP